MLAAKCHVMHVYEKDSDMASGFMKNNKTTAKLCRILSEVYEIR